MISEINAKTILNRSSIGDYCINPYVGCAHACVYCYASYYSRRMGYRGNWGSYVFAKRNAVELLIKEMRRKERGVVYISSFTDAYQPAEGTYRLTRRILEVLLPRGWPVIIQTKSPLVLRDLDLISSSGKAEVGFTIITLEEGVRELLEPGAPRVDARINALKELKESGVRTFTFVGPIIPGTPLEDLIKLVNEVEEFSDLIYFDKFRLKPGLRDIGEFIHWAKSVKAEAYYRRVKAQLRNELSGKVKHIFLF